MGKIRTFLIFFAWLLILGAIPGAAVYAQSAPTPERERIEVLIKQVGDLKEAKFIRNGWTYGVSTAVRFLRGKWEANDANIKTARDFIDRVASVSGTSGKPYLIRFRDGREIKSRDFLLAQLEKLDSRP
jgi:hypothetical protein